MWRGARRKRRYGKTDHRQNPPAYRRRDGGGETKKDKLKANTGAKTKETKLKPSRRLPSWRGGRDKRRKPTRNGKVAQPTVPRGGEVPSRKRVAERKQNNVHHKEKKTKHTVLCHCVSSQITLPAPRLGAEEGVGGTTKKKRKRKNNSPVPRLSGPITQTRAPY